MTEINSKNDLYLLRHFTEHLVGVFRKSPRESNLKHKTSSFSILQLKKTTGASPATILTKPTKNRTKFEPLFKDQRKESRTQLRCATELSILALETENTTS
jgi:hypothetical protein